MSYPNRKKFKIKTIDKATQLFADLVFPGNGFLEGEMNWGKYSFFIAKQNK